MHLANSKLLDDVDSSDFLHQLAEILSQEFSAMTSSGYHHPAQSADTLKLQAASAVGSVFISFAFGLIQVF